MLVAIMTQMTSNSAPSPYVAASKDGSVNAWKPWATPINSEYVQTGGVYPMWISIDLGAATVVNGYWALLQSSQGFWTQTDWTFQGSNDNSSWTTLDTQTGIGSGATTTGLVTFSNTTAYRYYRFNVTAGAYGAGFGDIHLYTPLSGGGGGGGGPTRVFQPQDGVCD